jgi:4-amino-4-deoxy-L-arabinose transferase-like glycosyltransferase
VSSETSSRRRVWPLAVALLGLAAAFLRFETLAARPLWYDEIYTDRICRGASALAEVWQVGAEDGWQHPPLHYALTYLSLGAGDSLASLRLPSALAGVAAVVLLACLGAALFDRRVGLAAGLLLGASVYHVAYSLDARPYALLVALLTGQFLAFAAAARGRRFALLLFVLCGTAAVYTHHAALVVEGVLGLLALGQLAAAWVGRRPEAGVRRHGLRAAALCVASFGAIALLYASQLPNTLQFLASHRERLEETYTLALTPGFLHQVVARWGAGPGWAAVAYEVAFAAGLVAILRQRDRSAGLLLWVAVPFLPYVWIPFAKFFDLRFAIAALPAFHLIVAAGVVFLAERAAAAVRALGGSAAAARAAPPLAGALALGALLVPSLGAYATLRTSRVLCGNFFQDHAILDADGGFCRKHLVLNSLVDPGMLRGRGSPPAP